MERGSWGLYPAMTTMDPALGVILQPVECGCTLNTKCTIIRCNCKSNKLFCTELYSCERTEDESCIKLMLDDQSNDEVFL